MAFWGLTLLAQLSLWLSLSYDPLSNIEGLSQTDKDTKYSQPSPGYKNVNRIFSIVIHIWTKKDKHDMTIVDILNTCFFPNRPMSFPLQKPKSYDYFNYKER